MWNSRKKLPRWTAILQEDKNNGREEGQREGSKLSSRESLALDSESTQQQSKSFSSAWKPVWYTGWHTGVLAWASSVIMVLFINVGLTIYVATIPKYKMVGGIGILYKGSCDKSMTIGVWLHLGINALSILLLSGSNYTQQCLAVPTQSEIDIAHASRRWMDIGVPSIRNLFRIKWERTFLWIAIGLTSIPLHLLYNSTVYTSLAANSYFVNMVTNNHFEPSTYRNQYGDIGYQTNSPEIQVFINALAGLNPSPQGYEDLTPLECKSHNTRYNNTILFMDCIYPWLFIPSQWMCEDHLESGAAVGIWLEGGRVVENECDPSEATTNLTSGLLWLVKLKTLGVVEIAGCKSEITDEECTVQFSLDIMIVVICCNLVKACCMVMAITQQQWGYAWLIDSSLSGSGGMGRGLGRGSGGKRECRVIIATAASLGLGMKNDRKYSSTDLKSIGILHWLTSQSIFLRKVEMLDPFETQDDYPISVFKFSCIAIILVLTLGILALLTAAGMGYKKFAAEITSVSSCSAAISTVCHALVADPEEIIGKKVRWGDVGIVPSLGVRHLTFSSEKGVKKPAFGEAYAETQRD
ncbi:hypothetical protein B9Z19DRAFT_1136677 [Tuber borchii]|uniref:DUF6536 domain-containing protein n=1 Tax=Tuber borchii TaxID=42251 RepID=A0A2T6ZBE8_TUBBO|nr:hypothetical protein B9Z19DRAFT_1136677 [Tuber borchii]